MKRRSVYLVLLVAGLVLGVACNGAGVTPAVTAVSIDQGDQTLEVGATVALTATVDLVGGASDAVVWSVDDDAVASVDASGVVTGVAVGVATVTATSVDDDTKSDSVEVTVVAPSPAVVSVSIDQGDQALEVGGTIALTASVVVVGGASDAVVWSVEDDAVASVDASGVVTGVAAGVATVTATSVDDDTKSDSVEVTVILAAEVVSVSIDQGDQTLDVGATVALTATVDLVGGASDAVVWSVDDDAVASVDASGVVTGVAAGVATVTATSVDDDTKSDSISVTVLPVGPAVVTVSIDEGDQTLEVGATVTLTASVVVVGGASDAVVWSVEDDAVASVDASGVVTGVAAGVATVTATSVDDDTKSDSVEVTVILAAEVVSVSIDQGDQTLDVGATVALTATVDLVGGASDAVVWSVDDDAVASVDASGVVTGVAAGVATVTATSVDDATKSDSVEVTVRPEASVGVAMDGTYVTLGNVSLSAVGEGSGGPGTRELQFDISWNESWRGPDGPTYVASEDNWDAVWVFVKYRTDGGPWEHATLMTSAESEPAGAAVDATPDGRGAFVYRAAPGYGTFEADGVKVVWDFVADVGASAAIADLQIFAVEMVYVPPGSFSLGTGGGERNGFRAGSSTAPFVVAGQGTIGLGSDAGELNWNPSANAGDPSGSTDSDYPTGFDAFYAMKYQVTQGQYVSFLNTLTQEQADERQKTTTVSYRYAVTGTEVGEYATTLPFVPMNFVSWADGAAFSAWAGLRPMTELEFEKAARGTAAPVVEEFAWGSTGIVAATGLVDAGTELETPTPGGANANFDAELRPEGPVRVGSFAAPSKTREQAGASFYGLMEMSGNLWERAVTIGNDEGRAFSGLHGDGSLDASGNANVMGWPAGIDPVGAGFRGGSWAAVAERLRVSDRDVAALSAPNLGQNVSDFGWRSVRSAP